ncbi:MAG: bifunctional NAD(P)H-hydrate repair enzyme [Acidimicrobiales bacterium]|nr:MAG: bifunctional NAD(P)H-hydrate repair enzyme [Acidimicrobiales bacterium]
MIPVVTPEEMKAIDEAAPEPTGVLIRRAGGAVFHEAVRLLGGTYGRRVVVLAGKGNNGNDGREAARRLRRRGAHVTLVPVQEAPRRLPDCDLVIDAAFGTGFRGDWAAPEVGEAPVLAVDIPSGVDGLTGEAASRVLPAQLTVTFAALKPGHLFLPGALYRGELVLADIGLDTRGVRTRLVTRADLHAIYPSRPPDSHKWRSAVWVIGGSSGMEGAAWLASSAAFAGGAGYVRWSAPGGTSTSCRPPEVVAFDIPAEGWASAVLSQEERFGAVVVGCGLGSGHRREVIELVGHTKVPVVVDGDGLTALAGNLDVLDGGGAPVVLTPHDGEFARLAGAPPGPDRIAAARELARETSAIVLLKGPCTVVADPSGEALLVSSGDARLASAGTGDVLAGLVGAFMARGAAPHLAAAAAAFVHGAASSLCPSHGLRASDLVSAVADWLGDFEATRQAGWEVEPTTGAHGIPSGTWVEAENGEAEIPSLRAPTAGRPTPLLDLRRVCWQGRRTSRAG